MLLRDFTISANMELSKTEGIRDEFARKTAKIDVSRQPPSGKRNASSLGLRRAPRLLNNCEIRGPGVKHGLLKI